MKTGIIVLIPFPFSELIDIKVRPAVVIALTRDKYKDLILSAISSQIPQTISSCEILINPTRTNGLRLTSVIKVDRIFTLKREKVIATPGKITASQTKELITIFKSLVG